LESPTADNVDTDLDNAAIRRKRGNQEMRAHADSLEWNLVDSDDLAVCKTIGA
jgi:hypothetical protein